MTCVIEGSLGVPGASFWDAYEQLWRRSADGSPFQAPRLLRYFSAYTQERVVVFAMRQENRLTGAVLLKERKGQCSFLSDLKTDVNAFVLDRRCSESEQRVFFRGLASFLREKGWSLELNNQLLSSPHLAFLKDAAWEEGLGWLLVPHSVCPVVEAASPEALGVCLQGKARYRYFAKRLRAQEGAVFCAEETDDGLEAWVEAYAEAHVRRWARTNTPSAFASEERRRFLLSCLSAWYRDGVGVRFSLQRPDGVPLAFAIGLRQPPALVFHATTFDPQFARYSPGKALLYHLGEWVAAQGFSVLDFGDGDEAYKYETATGERPLARVFICYKRQLSCQAKARAFQCLKRHPAVEQLYRRRVKPCVAKAALLIHSVAQVLEGLLAGL